ncbi:MAG: S8 family serine peptidase, partial [Anaerolineae bacterium]
GIDDDGNGYVDDVVGWNFPEDNGMPADFPRGARGTMNAGIAAAATHNRLGVAGLSWGARIMPLKVLFPDQNGLPQGYPDDVTEAVCYAANNGARVIMIEGWFFEPALTAAKIVRMQEAIEFAHRRAGAVVVAPAGDCGDDAPDWCPKGEGAVDAPIYPAHLPHVIGVQGVAAGSMLVHPNASHGPWVGMAAPGDGYYTTALGSTYREVRYAEVSQAVSNFGAAHVAGAAALLIGLDPSVSPLQVEDTLCRTANRTVGGPYPAVEGRFWNDRYGCGILDVEKAAESMRWRATMRPPKVVLFTDGQAPWPVVRFSSLNLNQGMWELRSEANWLKAGSVTQVVGQPAWAPVEADLEALAIDVGPLLSGVEHAGVLQACPIPEARGDCTAVSYRLRVVDRVTRLYLPWVGDR